MNPSNRRRSALLCASALAIAIPDAAHAASLVSIVPVPGSIDTESAYICAAFPDFLGPEGGLVSEEMGCAGVPRIWSPSSGAMTIEPPAGFDSLSVCTLLPGGGALLDIRTNNGTQRRHAFWTPDQPMEFIDDAFPGVSLDPQDWMFDASADRSAVVGAHLVGLDPFEGDGMVWWRGGAPLAFPPLDGFARGYFAFVSDDGTVAAGACDSQGGGDSRAWVWREGEGVQAMGVLPGDLTSFVSGISGDGRTIVGKSSQYDPAIGDLVDHAFRWTEVGGLEALGDPPPDGQGTTWEQLPRGVTCDGSLIWGDLNSPEQFVWTPATGMVFPEAYLVDHRGLDLIDEQTGCAFELGTILGISDDGRTWLVYAQLDAPCAPGAGYYLMTIPSICAGDLDADNDTDVADFGMFVQSFGQSVTPGTGADLDGNGIVDVFDFAMFVLDFGCAP